MLAKENHWQTFAQVYNPAFSHEIAVPAQSLEPMVMDERKIIARRAAMETCRFSGRLQDDFPLEECKKTYWK